MRRGLKLGMNSALLILAVTAITVMVYYLSVRHPAKYDLTKGKINTISSETQGLLAKLNKPVRAIVLFPDDQNPNNQYARQKINDLFMEASRRTKMFTFSIIDPNRDPVQMNNLGMNEVGVVFESGKLRKKAYMDDLFGAPNPESGEEGEFKGEQALYNAIIALAFKKTVHLCFSTGHGEKDILDNQTEQGLGIAVKLIEGESYVTQVINVGKNKGIPLACNVLIAAGPQTAFSTEETDYVGKYLDAGGRIFLMIDPFAQTGLETALRKYGVVFERGIVMDEGGMFSRVPYELMPRYKPHPITDKLSEKKLTINMELARSLDVSAGAGATSTVTALLETSDQAQLISSVNENEVVKRGTLPLAAAVQAGSGSKEVRAVAVGDSDFISNKSLALVVQSSGNTTVLQQGGTGNADFFMNSINWLAGEENLISIRPKSLDYRPLTLDPSLRRLVFILFSFIIPVGIIIFGAIIWNRRRHL